MSSALVTPAVPENLDGALTRQDASVVSIERRRELLARSFELRSGREKAGRYWKIDLDALAYDGVEPAAWQTPEIAYAPSGGVIVCDLATATRDHRELFERAFGKAANAEQSKFAALATALCNTGAFVYVPADIALDDPIHVTYRAGEDALFPYTLVFAERGSRCTVVEEVTGSSAAFVGGVAEIVSAENSSVTYASVQVLTPDSRALFTRSARPGKDASVVWLLAELGASLSVAGVDVVVDHPGVEAQINALFFPRDDQHVDLISTVSHDVGESQSQTLVKSAATGRGQARYLGNIRIAPHAQATEASLRDDALLLSKRAHIDSIPALEIAANDVKAYHGATVGALDDDQIFYMTSRGIEREAAEKMIALGFFEPVVERFPTNALREQIRAALEAKVRA